jgi:hypothetical protein
MTLIKKNDVKMHFSSHRDKGLHLVQQVGNPAVILLPVADTAIEMNGSVFEDDFLLEHSSRGGAVSAVVMVGDLDDTQIPEAHNTSRP